MMKQVTRLWLVLTTALVGSAAAVLAADLGLESERLVLIVGDELTTHINVSNTGPFVVWGATLKHDATYLSLVEQNHGTETNFVPDSRGLAEMNASGEVRVGGYAFENRTIASGSLGRFRYMALTPGSTQISTEDRSGPNPFGNEFQVLGGSAQSSPTLGPASLNVTILDAADNDSDGMSDAWESFYFGGTNAVGGGAEEDWDKDGQTNGDEYDSRTDPVDPSSVLAFVQMEWMNGKPVLRWRSITGKQYKMIRSGTPDMICGTNEATGIAATPPLNTYTSNVDTASSGFYRLALE